MLRLVSLSEVATQTTKKLYDLPGFLCSGSDAVFESCQQPCHVEINRLIPPWIVRGKIDDQAGTIVNTRSSTSSSSLVCSLLGALSLVHGCRGPLRWLALKHTKRQSLRVTHGRWAQPSKGRSSDNGTPDRLWII